jgi:TrmH family RNA methyltransferase
MLQMQGMERKRISSRDNPRVKLARKVRDGKDEDLVFVEGLRLAEEAAQSNLRIEYCIVTPEFGSSDREAKLLGSLSDVGVEILEVDDRIFQSIAETRSPQGTILICRRPTTDRVSFEKRIGPRRSELAVIVMLYEVNNPSNLGAVLRTAEAADVQGIIVSSNSADVLSPKSVRSSMGSVFRLPIWSNADPGAVFEFAKQGQYSLTAVAADGDLPYLEIEWKIPQLLVFGSEAHGLPRQIFGKMDQTIAIPMNAEVESLNLAVAAGVILFEARRQVVND